MQCKNNLLMSICSGQSLHKNLKTGMTQSSHTVVYNLHFTPVDVIIYPLHIPPAPAEQGDLNVKSEWFLTKEESIVIGDIIHSDGLRVLVFSTNECMEILSRAETIQGK